MILDLSNRDAILIIVGWLGNEAARRAIHLYQNWRFERSLPPHTVDARGVLHFDGDTGEELSGAPVIVLDPDQWAVVDALAGKSLTDMVLEAESRGVTGATIEALLRARCRERNLSKVQETALIHYLLVPGAP